MAKFQTKLTTIFILAAMLLLMIPQTTFAVTWLYEEVAPEFEEIIYYRDGTNSDNMSGAFSIVKDSDGNECYSVGSASYIRQIFFDVKDLVEQGAPYHNDIGQFMISFDIQMRQKDMGLNFYIDDTRGGGAFPIFCINGGGKMFLNDDKNGTPAATYLPPDTVRDYEANTWYNIKLVFYAYEQYVDFYVDDEYWARRQIPRDYLMSDKVYTENTLDQIFFNTRPDYKLDANGAVLPADASGIMYLDNFTYGLPKKRSVEIDYWKNEVGNIYDGNNVNFGCDLINRTDKTDKFTFEYDIRTDMNKSVRKGSDIYEIKPGEKQAVPLLSYAPEYGFYTANAKLYNSSGELVFEESTRFSIIAPQNGVNERMGVNIHNTGHGSSSYGPMPDVLDVTKKLGIGNTRDVYAWYSCYLEDGFTRSSHNGIEITNRFFPETNNKNLAVVSILTEAYNLKYDDPAVPDLLSRYAKYCRQLALDLDPAYTSYYEIENEWWLKGDVNYSGVQYDFNVSSDVKLLAEMIKIANREIKAVNPDAKIAIMDGTLIGYEYGDALLEALGPDPGQHFDVIAVHDYMASVSAHFPEQYMRGGGIHDGGIQVIQSLIEKYGLQDKEIWSTEYGTTTGYHRYDIDMKLNGDYYVRQYMFDTQWMDKIYIYQLIRDRYPSSEYEGGFGILDKGTVGDVRYGALPAAVELAAFNSLLNRSEFVSEQIIGDDGTADDSKDIYIYKYKTAEGKDCYAIFNATSEMNVSFDFGADNVKVYDAYGNATTLSALDGYITMNVNTAPKYVVADDLKDEVTVRESPLFDMTREVSTTLEDAFNFEVSKDTDANAEITIECSANTSLGYMSGFSDNRSKINMVTYSDRQYIEEYQFDDNETKEEIVVSIGDGSKVYYKEPLKIRYLDSLESTLKLVPYRNGRWQALLTLKNNKTMSPISGEIQLSTGDTADIGTLISGQKNTFRFNLPEDVEKKSYTVSSTITLTDGSVIEDSDSTNFISVEKAYISPTIDGKIDMGEWKNSGTVIKLGDGSPYIKLANDAEWNGEEDLSGEVYLMYDDTYFYLAAEVTDNIHCGYDDQGRAWAMDSLQFGISKNHTKTSEYTEMGIALSDSGETILQKYTDVNESMVYFDKTKINEFDEGTEYKATLNGNVTTYELKMPWTELTQDSKAPDDYLIFSVLLNENDGMGRTAFMEWELASGIGKGKDPSAYALIPMND